MRGVLVEPLRLPGEYNGGPVGLIEPLNLDTLPGEFFEVVANADLEYLLGGNRPLSPAVSFCDRQR